MVQGEQGKILAPKSAVVHMQVQLIMSSVIFGVYFSVLQAIDKQGHL